MLGEFESIDDIEFIVCLRSADRSNRMSAEAWGLAFAACDTLSLLSCAGTCQRFCVAVAAEFRIRAYLLFHMFFTHRVRHFTGLLRLHEAVVSGSTALTLFMSPVEWQPGDLTSMSRTASTSTSFAISNVSFRSPWMRT